MTQIGLRPPVDVTEAPSDGRTDSDFPQDVFADGPARLTFRTWDGATLGANHGTAVLDLVPRLDLSAPAILTPVDADDPSSAATFESMMSASRVVSDHIGVAVFQTTGAGIWQYSTDAGANWTNFPKVSIARAFLLPVEAQVRFVANAEPINAGTARLKFKAWDRTFGAEGEQIAVVGTAFSRESETVTVAVKNTAPTLTVGTGVILPPVKVSPNVPGVFVSRLLAKGAVTDSSRGLRGVAVIAVDNTNGTWQYFLGGAWKNFGTVSADSAVLLTTVIKFRFVPSVGTIPGTTAAIQFKAWDGTTGQAGDRGVDTTFAGQLNSFSSEIETATVTTI